MFILVLCTVNSKENAKNIAQILVKEKLAACVNIIKGIESLYLWENEIADDDEFLLLIKTKKNLYEKLESRIKEIHPYEIPEIICFPIEKGLPEYLNWIDKSTL